MLIECSLCEGKVSTNLLGEKMFKDEHGQPSSKSVFLECVECGSVIVGTCDFVGDVDDYRDWSSPIRMWPEGPANLHYTVPDKIKKSLNEAQKCYTSATYSACAVMCGKALEGICADKGSPPKSMLAGGLKFLKDKSIIDQRLFEWGEALRKQRNIGAHAGEDEVTRQDARDVLDFAMAICDYVYELSDKYEEYKARQEKKEKAKAKAKDKKKDDADA